MYLNDNDIDIINELIAEYIPDTPGRFRLAFPAEDGR